MITLAVSNLGTTPVFIGHEWLKRHNPVIDWKSSRIAFTRCHSCEFIDNESDIDDDEETLVDEEEESFELEEGDRLFAFDIDSYLEQEHLVLARIVTDTGNKTKKKTRYDYVYKYDPNALKSKNWTETVPKAYHNYEDVFTKKDFDKLPER